MRILKQVLASGLGLLLAACASMPDADPGPAAVGGAISTFESPEQIDAYLAAQRDELAYIRKRKQEEGYQERIVVTGSQIADVAITNTQEEGVDEGGIVKANSEYLVILRRGRIHVVRHGDDTLEPVSSIDAFPPDDPDPDDTWYDEMLLHKGTVIIIGYSYGEDGTEISRFDLSDDGELSYRDTHYLNSWDYYSSSNYASRLVGGTLYTYTPSSFDADWRDELPFLERRTPDGSRVRIATTLEPQRMGIAAPQLIDVAPNARMMHGITQCDILSEQLTCSTRTVLGTRSSEYYFSAEAAYIWTGSGHDNAWGRASKDWQELVFRIPFDYSKDMTAMSVQGDPVDQFSFLEDGETGSLFVMTVGDFVFDDYDGFGMMMWESEYAFGEAALARIPLSDMGNGSDMLPPSHYRALPEVSGRVQNRYVGRHLMVGGGYWRDDESPSEFYVTPLDEGWVQRIDLPHEVSRLDRLGNDGMVVGRGDEDALGFSAIEFSEDRPGSKLASIRRNKSTKLSIPFWRKHSSLTHVAANR